MSSQENCDVEIEMLDSSEVPEEELMDFQETIPLRLEEVAGKINLPLALKKESEEVLITKYVNGEASFPDYYTTLEPEDDNEEFVVSETKEMKDIIPDVKSTVTAIQSSRSTLDSQDNKKRARAKRGHLNVYLQGLMGEANLSFVRGQVDVAEKICLEIIRQNPLAPEPFFTLAQIYETRDAEKFLQFSTIAAHLDPGNRDQWIRIAELNIEKKNFQQARVCYSKAIANLPKDHDMRLRKAKLLEFMNDERDAMLTYLRLIAILPPEMGELCLNTAKKVARYFHAQEKFPIALKAMQDAYSVVPKLFSTEDLNLYLDLLVINKKYCNVLTILRDRCEIGLELEQDGEETIVLTSTIPYSLIPDFRVKVCVSLIKLKATHLIDYIVNNVIDHIPIVSGLDWYVDIAEALMSVDKHAAAIRLLTPVLQSPTFAAPAYVWLRHAECHRALGDNEKAIESYYQVIELAPYCFDAKFTLSALLKQQGRHREAIKALEQDMDGDTIDARLLYERCLMLKTVGELDQYIELGCILLARNAIKFTSREEIQMVANNVNNCKLSNLKFAKHLQDTFKSSEQTPVSEDDLTLEDEYALFKDLSEKLFKNEKYATLEKLCFSVITTKKFKPKTTDILKFLTVACYYNDDALFAFIVFRDAFSKNVENNSYWNLCNIITHKLDNANYYKFFKRLFARQTCQSYLKILLGNYHLAAGSYKYALNVYAGIYRDSQDPLIALLISVIFSQLGLQKNVLRKSTALAQANAFMRKYADLRLSPLTKQEVYYNLGRMYHQVSMFHLALHWYKLVLEAAKEVNEEEEEILGLTQEAAFNIHLIYKANGNITMARKYLYDYITV